MADSDICAFSNALASDYLSAVSAINRKLKALQRFAQILEQLGNLSLALPNLAPLLPVLAINPAAYLNLIQSCPFLNLPALPSLANIASLQSLVSSAYDRLIQGLKLHPFSRLGLLQAQMDKVQGSVSGALGTGSQFLQCFQAAACGAGDGFVNNFTASASQEQLNQFSRNFTASNGQVLTPAQQQKVAVIKNMIAAVQLLKSTAAPIQPVNVNEFRPVPIPTDHPVPPPPIAPIQP